MVHPGSASKGIKTRKGGKTRKCVKGRKGSKTRKGGRRQSGGKALTNAAGHLQAVANTIAGIFQDDKARSVITSKQANLQSAKRGVAAATQAAYKTLNGIAEDLVGEPGTGRVIGRVQQAANTQFQTRVPGMYYQRSIVRP